MLKPALDNTSHVPHGGLSSQCHHSVPFTASSLDNNNDHIIAILYISANVVLCKRYSTGISKKRVAN
jgi:hypothetical protein